MRNFIRLLLSGILVFHISVLWGQEKVVRGVVSGEGSAPISGASVTVKGSTRGTQTDAQGVFTISAKKGDVLVISHVGYSVSEFRVGDNTNINILMREQGALEEVVVAMDIKRNPRELGYSVQKVDGKEIAETQRENFLNSLQGRVAGLSITPTTGAAGASSQIILRGYNSLSLSNQPLFVVDGVILDNTTMNETSNGGSGLGLASDRPNRNNDYTNRIADINPGDIESVTILKGPEATALYGSQASSGAVVITTKKAVPGRMSVNYDNAFRFRKLTRTADINNDFSTGLSGVPNFPGAVTTFFGPAYPKDTKMYDNVDAFFETGFAQTHNLSADLGTKNVGFRLSTSLFDEKSVVPRNQFKRYNVRLTNTTKISKKISLTPSLQYIRSVNDKPLRSAGGYLLTLYTYPGEYDARDYLDENGHKKTLFAADYNAESDNPFFNANFNHGQDKTDRYIGTLGVDLYPTDWLTVAGRFGFDHYNTQGYTFYHPESAVYSRATGGFLDNYWRKYNGYNHTITATARKTMGKWGGRIMVGTMWQDYRTQMFAISGSQLRDSMSTDSSNTAPNTRQLLLRNKKGEWNESIIRQMAYFGEASISYDNVLFLSYSHRFEAASVFPKKNRNYNYPGVSLSAIMSDIIPNIKNKWLNYWKIRTSLAGTARLPDPYRNQSVFVDNFASSQGPAYSYGFDNNNADLMPEKQATYEIGTEAKLFNNFLGLDMAYYNTLCTDQISQGYRASYATGFVLNTQNAAKTRNQGVEVVLDLAMVRKTDWDWNMRLNFNKMWSEVLELPKAIVGEYYIADTWLYSNARGGLYRGMQTTTITGFHYQRNTHGDILINPATGLPVVEGTFTVIGDRAPDFTLGALNSVRYRNWSLSILWDLKVGGDIFNATDMFLTLQGKSQRTADRRTPRVIKGVLQDGLQNTDNPTPNNIVVNPYYSSTYYTAMPPEEFIEKDVNWLRLRDVSLNYAIPATKLRGIKGFKSLSFFVTANDLVLITNYTGGDPSVNGNTAGSSGVGGFGFDYGSLATPMAINFGLRAGF